MLMLMDKIACVWGKNCDIDCTYINNGFLYWIGEKKEWVKCLTSQKTHKFCGERGNVYKSCSTRRRRKIKDFYGFCSYSKKWTATLYFTVLWRGGLKDLWNNWTYNDNYINFYKFVVPLENSNICINPQVAFSHLFYLSGFL